MLFALGSSIREARKRRGLTQAAVAKTVEIGRAALSLLEAGMIREIGVRKAIGAKSRDIVMQFLVESMLISLIGGILGIILGLLGAFLIMWFIKGTLVIAWWEVILATGVSAAVGIFFGVYPALRAARLDPVIALRYE